MLQLEREEKQTNLPHEPDQINTRKEYTDEKISRVVFEYNGLSEGERRIMEGK